MMGRLAIQFVPWNLTWSTSLFYPPWSSSLPASFASSMLILCLITCIWLLGLCFCRCFCASFPLLFVCFYLFDFFGFPSFKKALKSMRTMSTTLWRVHIRLTLFSGAVWFWFGFLTVNQGNQPPWNVRLRWRLGLLWIFTGWRVNH